MVLNKTVEYNLSQLHRIYSLHFSAIRKFYSSKKFSTKMKL